MNTLKTETGHRAVWTLALTFVLTASHLTATPAAAARPPADRTYFTVLLGLEESFSWSADCLSFTELELCSLYGMCGSWYSTEPAGRETAIAFEMTWEKNGTAVHLDGQARIDQRGRAHSLAGVANLRVAGRNTNFGFTGKPMSAERCADARAAWKSVNRPEDTVVRSGACLQRASFGSPDESLYILPFSVGSSHEFLQSYCTNDGSHNNQLAYDIPMPLGVDILAARSGVVMALREEQPDDGANCQDHNYVYIQHDDGSVAFYAHLMQNGVLVEVGDRVEVGQVIALNGNSCTNYSPLLHFGVYTSWPVVHGDDLPVNFRNAIGPLDERGGLMAGQTYTALPY